jgi:hypothetical protein
MARSIAALVVSAALLAGCGVANTDSPTGRRATVHVRQEWVGGGLYVEGSYSYARVERDGSTVEQVRLTGEKMPSETIRIEPGTYRLVSFQRPGDGNCGTLDPPTDQCSRRIDVEVDVELREVVSLSPGEGCTISEEQKID